MQQTSLRIQTALTRFTQSNAVNTWLDQCAVVIRFHRGWLVSLLTYVLRTEVGSGHFFGPVTELQTFYYDSRVKVLGLNKKQFFGLIFVYFVT